MESNWIYQGKELTEVPEGYFGFIYLITNTVTGVSYVGKKNFFFRRSKKVPGKKNRKYTTKESDWKKYFGSCQEIKEEIKKSGTQPFRREILKLCVDKRELTYSEVEEQFRRNVLFATLPSGLRAYYNRNILSRFFARD